MRRWLSNLWHDFICGGWWSYDIDAHITTCNFCGYHYKEKVK